MRSCLYDGLIRHRRHAPIEHRFQYRIWLAWLDLDELADAFRGRWLWSATRPALVRFRREDHLGNPGEPLADAVRGLVEDRTGVRPAGPVRLLTPLRYAGFWINPVCFYYCYAADGETVEWIVAEVNNTPWNERHCYVIDARRSDGGSIRATHAKEFHVSPFMGMDQQYLWNIGLPDQSLQIDIANHEAGRRRFDAQLSLQRREITSLRLAWTTIRYPFQTLRVFSAIYWQALKLWWKKCPYYPHPRKQQPTAAPR